MSLTSTDKISLDFYNVNIETVNAKQNDNLARYINITCTDHGKKVTLDSSICSAYIRYKTNNGFVFEDTEILDDGTILVSLSSQMLSSVGRHSVDLMITTLIGVVAGEIVSLEDVYAKGATVISTMSFYLNVIGSEVSDDEITSTLEFSLLTHTMTKLKALEYAVETNEEDRKESEVERQNNEEIRKQQEQTRCDHEVDRREAELQREISESSRATAEALRVSYESNRINAETARAEAEIKRQDDVTGEEYRIAQEDARQKAEEDRVTAMEQYIEEWDAAVQSIVDQSGVVMKTEKGVANGIATLDENVKIPYEQLDIANNLTTATSGKLLDASQGTILKGEITNTNQAVTNLTEDVPKQIKALKEELEAKIAALPEIHFLNVIDHNIGKEGDLLLVPFEE